MFPAALSCSSSGGSSPPTSPGMSTPSFVDVEERDGYHFGVNAAGRNHDGTHHGASAAGLSSRQQQGPIAIVGMSCRLPGGASTPAEFWELCSRARSGFAAGAPKERFNHEAFYHSNPGKTGTYHSQGGYFLSEDVAAFDAPFFSLTEKEAIAMDPQQRLLLECTFEALESAGIPKHTVVGDKVGVFIGGSLSEYETHLSRDADSMPMYQSTGCAQAMQSNRLSHFFDFRGPSFTLDTACSSSLVALHVACQSLRNGESSVAVTGGCHLNMMPESFISFSTGRLLSDSGRSMAFDERGTGFGRGEGCGILVLKPLDQALADKDAIRAVIAGTGINQDGKTPGITMPNGDAQETLIKHVYASAGLDPKDCGFVEAHGTGTKVGDPLEAGAIYRALGQSRTSKDPLFIGSVKSNVGHLEAASGVAAVIKATLMLERGFILPNHDFKIPNKKIPWKDWNLAVPKSQRPWPKGKKYVSVNNFGFGGTNAHVVLERAPFPAKKPTMSRKGTSASAAELKEQPSGRRLFVLSGNDKKSLEAVMSGLVIYLEQRPEIFQSDLLEHLSYTLSRRSLLKWRVAIPAATSFELIEALNSNGTVPSKPSATGQGPNSDFQIGLVFTGQGAQWHAMGRELCESQGYPIYKASLDRADRYLHKLGAKWSLVEELTRRDATTSHISEAHISQPACTAVQLCLVDLLRSWGIRPAAVTGHSSGEIAAAYAAGFISFEAAVAIAYHRGKMVPILKEKFPRLEGAMMAVGGSREDIQPLIDTINSTPELAQNGQQIRIACYNSPSSLTVSGDSAGITALETTIRESQPETFNRRLQVDVAYHSHQMELVAKEYMETLQFLPQPKSGFAVQFFSSLHGRSIEASECDARYWVDNLTCPVRFSEALDAMVKPSTNSNSVEMLIEVGPHSALQGPVKQILQAAGVTKTVAYTSALVRKRNAVETVLELASTLITKGVLLRMPAINSPDGQSNENSTLLTDLPRYSWNHQSRYWHETRFSRMHTHRGSSARRSSLIGIQAINSTNLGPTWRNVFSLDDLPWLRHHQIQGLTVFPLAGFVAAAAEAAVLRAGDDIHKHPGSHLNTVELKDVEVLKPFAFPANVVDGDGTIEMSISLRRRHDPSLDEEWDEFQISSWSSDTEWTEHCIGLVMIKSLETLHTASHGRFIDETQMAVQGDNTIISTAAETTAMYEALSDDLGVAYGPSFRGLRDCKVAGHFSVGSVSTSLCDEGTSTSHPFLHATALESIIDMYWPVLRNGVAQEARETVYLPSSIRHMCIAMNGPVGDTPQNLTTYCKADFSGAEPRPTVVNVIATASLPGVSETLVSVEGLTVSPILEGIASGSDASDGIGRQLCYKYEWQQPEQTDERVTDRSSSSGLKHSEIVIIYGDAISPSFTLASQLAIALQSHTAQLPSLEGGIFEHAAAPSVEHLEAAVSGKTCIVLTELDHPFLLSATECQLETLKALASIAPRVLWVTSNAYIGSTSPGSNMISGISRTIRSETMMPFAHLDLDCDSDSNLSHCAGDLSEVIIDALGYAFDGSTPGVHEMEFVHRGGKLLVPRVISDGHMNQLVKRDTDPEELELQCFGQATAGGRALRMDFAPFTSASTRTRSGDRAIQGVRFREQVEATEMPLAPDEVEVEIKAIGVNKHDALVACDQSSSDSAGLEASGIVTRLGSGVSTRRIQVGTPVFCLTKAMKSHGPGAYATLARTTASTVIPFSTKSSLVSMDGNISFEAAAALPLAYCTAYHGLIDQAQLEPGQRVLITCPLEAVGQAAIVLALMTKADLFLIAESSETRAILANRLAGAVPDGRVICSKVSDGRGTYESIMQATNSAGVDVVFDLENLMFSKSSSAALWTSCLAPFGTLLQVQEAIGPVSQADSRVVRHRLHNTQPSGFFDNVAKPMNMSCKTIDMLGLGSARPQVLDRVIARVAELFESGKLEAISGMEVLPFSRAHEVLNQLAGSGASPTKYVLAPNADDQIMAPTPPSSKKTLKPDATYIIVGGTGGLGRSMAKWMIQNGAGTIVLLSRGAAVTPALESLIAEGKTQGAQILVRQCDVAKETSVSDLLHWISAVANLPPIRGVIHSAMVLHDVLFEKMLHAEYKAVIESKVQGAWNLHRALDGTGASEYTRLDFFVAVSSVSAIVGNRGQAAYAAANTFLDGLVQNRIANGLPAVSLALAAVSDAGYLADAEGGAARAADVLRNLGGELENTICEAEVLALLRAAVTGETASCGHHVITGVGVGGSRDKQGSTTKSSPFWAEDAKFSLMVEAAKGDEDGDSAGDGRDNPSSVLTSSLSQAEAEEVVCYGLVAKIAEVLMMEKDELDVTRNLSHYPLDSLVAIEIRNFIARQYEASMQVLELLSSGSIQTLSSTVCRKSKICQF